PSRFKLFNLGKLRGEYRGPRALSMSGQIQQIPCRLRVFTGLCGSLYVANARFRYECGDVKRSALCVERRSADSNESTATSVEPLQAARRLHSAAGFEVQLLRGARVSTSLVRVRRHHIPRANAFDDARTALAEYRDANTFGFGIDAA